MKTRILFILFLAVSLTNAKNPYEHFGYDNSEMETKMENLRQNKFMLINEDTTSEISALYFDFNLSKVSIFDKNGNIEEKQIPEEMQLRWSSVDPLANHPNQVSLSPYSSFWNNPVLYNDPSGLCPDCSDEEYPILANDAYTAKRGYITQNGWEAIKIDEKLGDYDNGYRGVLFRKNIDGNDQYIYSTAGTQDLTDMGNNLTQLLGGSSQYKVSVELASYYSKNYPGVSFTGHSLGGVLASANALKIGGKAVTFNPAALSEETKTNLKLNKDADIQRYVIQGELLDYLQWNVLGMESEGSMHVITPNEEYSNDPKFRMLQRLNNHFMHNILNYFNSKKK